MQREGYFSAPRLFPPEKYDINKDIDAFACRLTLKEYHTPENIEEIIDGPGYQPDTIDSSKIEPKGAQDIY